MYRIIINADDCGQSVNTNKKIEEFIQMGKVTSCTVMANRDDWGAIRLYKRYSDIVSFGAGEVKTWQL